MKININFRNLILSSLFILPVMVFSQVKISSAGDPKGALDLNDASGHKNTKGLVLPAVANTSSVVTPDNTPVVAATLVYDQSGKCLKYTRDTAEWSSCLLGQNGVNSIVNETLGFGEAFSIKQASAANTLSLVIGADDNAVYSTGANSNYLTGLGRNTGRLTSFTLFFAYPTESVSASTAHGILATKTGLVYTWGANANGKTSLNTTTGSGQLPALVEGGIFDDNNDIITYGRPIQVATTGTNSYVITDTGRLFFTGANTNGLNGNGITTGNILVLTENTFISGITPKINQISASNVTVGVSNGTNTIYVWGSGASNALGDGATAVVSSPKAVTLPKPIKQVAMGLTLGAALAADGKSVYVWGVRSRNGIGGTGNQPTPQEILLPAPFSYTDDTILSVEAARFTNAGLVVTTTKGTFVTGVNTNGRLGNGLTATIATGFSLMNTENTSDTKVLGVSLGVNHSIIITGQQSGATTAYTAGYGVGAVNNRQLGAPYTIQQVKPAVLSK